MNSLSLTFAMGYEGRATGTAASPTVSDAIGDVARCSPSGANWQVYKGTLTLGVSGGGTDVVTLDLTTGLTGILGEAISGTPGKFLTIFGVFIEHDVASLATVGGISAFGGGSNDFQGLLASGDKFSAVLPGDAVGFLRPANGTGMTVDGTHKNIKLTNLDSTALHVATVNVFILGKVA